MQVDTPTITTTPALESVTTLSTPTTSYSPTLGSGESSTRRQHIAMACQYCRHRKIKCCGSTPCANCTRARRTCDYTPVPEEVNRATREKKAAAKAAKIAYAASRAAPYYVDQSIYSIPYLAGPGPIRGTHVPPRRAFSTPGLGATGALPPYSPVPGSAPAMSSPAFDSPWFHTPPVPVINVSPMMPVMPTMGHPEITAAPSLPAEYTEEHSAYASTYTGTPVSPTESSTSTSYAMPVTPVRKAILETPPHTPQTACFQSTPNLLTYTPQLPFSSSPLAHPNYSTSPTLCPGLPVQAPKPPPQQGFVGLGIGLPVDDAGTYTSTVSTEYLSVSPTWASHGTQYI